MASFFAKLADTPETQVESVRRNLEAVLNAKRGYGGSVEVFGLGQYEGSRAWHLRCEALSAEMLEQIRRFEPRLAEPSITLRPIEQNLWLQFVLMGRCDGAPCAFVLHFHSILRNVRVTIAI